MARLHIHPIGLVLIFFGLLVWVVALGGIAASTKYCNDNRPKDAPKSYCASSYQMEWWSIWFEFLLLLVMLLTCFTNAFDRARMIYLSYLSMVTVLLTMTAKGFLTNSFSSNGFNFKDYKADAYGAAAAGSVLLCITNFALIIFIGLGHNLPSAFGGLGGGAPTPLSALGSTAPEAKYAPTTYQPSNF